MNRGRTGLVAVLVGIAAAVAAGLVAPQRANAAVETVGSAILREVPTPILAGLVLLLAVVLWFVLFRYVLALCYRGWRRIASRVKWAVGLVLPESPLVRFAAGSMVFILLVLGIVAALPVVFGDLSESEGGAASYVDRIGGTALNAEWDDIVDGDAASGEPACGGGIPEGRVVDRDDDGLPDAWERAGETPDGATLSGASPDHKDLYVQVEYATNVERLSESQRRELREVWARMPVSNPDGSPGITLHLDDEAPRGGRLNESGMVAARSERDAFYTESRLGPRQCVYHQVVYGRVEMGDLAGIASMPGYSVVVDGSLQPDYAGNVSFRTALTTHELLHNVAGRVDGRPHTDSGWLAGGPDDEFLSEATARDLTESGLHGPAN